MISYEIINSNKKVVASLIYDKKNRKKFNLLTSSNNTATSRIRNIEEMVIAHLKQ